MGYYDEYRYENDGWTLTPSGDCKDLYLTGPTIDAGIVIDFDDVNRPKVFAESKALVDLLASQWIPVPDSTQDDD